MLELAILGLLKERDRHGYELKQLLTEALGPFSSVSFGSLYPALSRLEAVGAVQAVETGDLEEGPAIPMTGSLGGEAAAFRARRGAGRRSAARSSRRRKVYAITGKGEKLFTELLKAESTNAADDRTFNLKLAFCRYLPPEARLGLLERRRALLVARLDRARENGRERRERMDAYMQSLIEHRTETVERDISWLDRLIADERRLVSDGKLLESP